MTFDTGSLDAMWTRGSAVAIASIRAWLRAMVEVEIALAGACAAVGVIPDAHARRIEAVAGDLALDVGAIGRDAAATGTPVVALIERIRAAVGEDAAASVHRGATSQDVVDSATMLVAFRSLALTTADLDAASSAAARLARTHRATPMAGRTLLQQAVPTTFGLKAANWMIGLDRANDELAEITRTGLAVQLGGAAGTLAGYGGDGRRIAGELARRLGLGVATAPWHTERTRIGRLAAALGVASGSIAKPARDIVLLAQTEVAEVEEGVAGRGASSAMPHKHNPVAAISAIACTHRSPGLVSTLLGSMGQEHERAAGNWQAEWVPLRELLVVVDSAAAWLTDSLGHLVVHADRMVHNLAAGIQPDGTIDIGEAPDLVDDALRAHETRTGS